MILNNNKIINTVLKAIHESLSDIDDDAVVSINKLGKDMTVDKSRMNYEIANIDKKTLHNLAEKLLNYKILGGQFINYNGFPFIEIKAVSDTKWKKIRDCTDSWTEIITYYTGPYFRLVYDCGISVHTLYDLIQKYGRNGSEPYILDFVYSISNSFVEDAKKEIETQRSITWDEAEQAFAYIFNNYILGRCNSATLHVNLLLRERDSIKYLYVGKFALKHSEDLYLNDYKIDSLYISPDKQIAIAFIRDAVKYTDNRIIICPTSITYEAPIELNNGSKMLSKIKKGVLQDVSDFWYKPIKLIWPNFIYKKFNGYDALIIKIATNSAAIIKDSEHTMDTLDSLVKSKNTLSFIHNINYSTFYIRNVKYRELFTIDINEKLKDISPTYIKASLDYHYIYALYYRGLYYPDVYMVIFDNTNYNIISKEDIADITRSTTSEWKMNGWKYDRY